MTPCWLKRTFHGVKSGPSRETSHRKWPSLLWIPSRLSGSQRGRCSVDNCTSKHGVLRSAQDIPERASSLQAVAGRTRSSLKLPLFSCFFSDQQPGRAPGLVFHAPSPTVVVLAFKTSEQRTWRTLSNRREESQFLATVFEPLGTYADNPIAEIQSAMSSGCSGICWPAIYLHSTHALERKFNGVTKTRSLQDIVKSCESGQDSEGPRGMSIINAGHLLQVMPYRPTHAAGHSWNPSAARCSEDRSKIFATSSLESYHCNCSTVPQLAQP